LASWAGIGGAAPFGGTSASGSDAGTGCEHALPEGTTLSVSSPSVAVLHGTGLAPLAVDDAFTMPAGSSLSVSPNGVLHNDLDAEGDKIVAVLVAPTSYGPLKLNADGSFTYVPQIDFVGMDEFQYLATDGTGMSAVTNVVIVVGKQSVAGPTMSLPGDDQSGTVASVSGAGGTGNSSSGSSGSATGSGSSSGSATGAGSSSGSETGDATAIVEQPTPRDTGSGTTTVTVNIGGITNTVTANGGDTSTTVETTSGGSTATVGNVSSESGVTGVTVSSVITPVPPVSVPPIVIDYTPLPTPSDHVDGDDDEGDDDEHHGDHDAGHDDEHHGDHDAGHDS